MFKRWVLTLKNRAGPEGLCGKRKKIDKNQIGGMATATICPSARLAIVGDVCCRSELHAYLHVHPVFSEVSWQLVGQGKQFRVNFVNSEITYWALTRCVGSCDRCKSSGIAAGDFGNKNVDLVAAISSLNFPKAAILGNHDCWFPYGSPASRSVFDRDPVEVQLELLGKTHVGYRRLDLPRLNISVVGGRPGSWGGQHMHKKTKKYFGASNMAESTELITKAALAAPEENFLLFLAHNGPTGLGSNPIDICGKDWSLQGGDHGDRDLEIAISNVKKERKVPLVVFGHMHKELQLSEQPRNMIVVGEDKSVYLNAAVVPRVRTVSYSNPDEDTLENLENQLSRNWLYEADESERPSERNFTLVELENGELKKISEVWVRVQDTQASTQEETVLYLTD